MTGAYLVAGFVGVVAIVLWIAVYFSRTSGRLKESEENLRRDLRAIEKFSEYMSGSKKTGEDLIASLRARARRGVRGKW